MRPSPSNPHIKSMNYIWYHPGYGGNFLQRLFALSEDTQFLWLRGSCGCMPADLSFEEKWRWYYYDRAEINHWMSDAHLMPEHLDTIWRPDARWQTGSTLVTLGHYWLSYNTFDPASSPDPEWLLLDPKIAQRYFYVDVDPASEELLLKWLPDLKKQGLEEQRGREWLHQARHPEPIYMSRILADQNEFTQEYLRVCGLMQLTPIDLDRAWAFQQNWRSLRIDQPPPGC